VAYQKFLNKIGLSVQQIFQRITLNLLGTCSLEELLNPRTPKNKNPYSLSLLGLAYRARFPGHKFFLRHPRQRRLIHPLLPDF